VYELLNLARKVVHEYGEYREAWKLHICSYNGRMCIEEAEVSAIPSHRYSSIRFSNSESSLYSTILSPYLFPSYSPKHLIIPPPNNAILGPL